MIGRMEEEGGEARRGGEEKEEEVEEGAEAIAPSKGHCPE